MKRALHRTIVILVLTKVRWIAYLSSNNNENFLKFNSFRRGRGKQRGSFAQATQDPMCRRDVERRRTTVSLQNPWCWLDIGQEPLIINDNGTVWR